MLKRLVSLGRNDPGANFQKFDSGKDEFDFNGGPPPSFVVPLTPPPNLLATGAQAPLESQKRMNETEKLRLQGLMRPSSILSVNGEGTEGSVPASRWDRLKVRGPASMGLGLPLSSIPNNVTRAHPRSAAGLDDQRWIASCLRRSVDPPSRSYVYSRLFERELRVSADVDVSRALTPVFVQFQLDRKSVV